MNWNRRLCKTVTCTVNITLQKPVRTFAASVFSERELKFMFAICQCHQRSICRLSSVTLVHPTQAIEIFGNICMPCGTLAIRTFV